VKGVKYHYQTRKYLQGFLASMLSEELMTE